MIKYVPMNTSSYEVLRLRKLGYIVIFVMGGSK